MNVNRDMATSTLSALEGALLAPSATVPSWLATASMYSSNASSPSSSPSPSPTGITGVPALDGRNCRLLGPFALIVQALMGLLVVGSLVYKRQHEHPRRKWKIWTLDISKQMTGQVFVHILNVILSDAVAKHGKRNPCSLYFLNIIIDTTFGVLIIYVTLNGLTRLLTERLGYDGFVSGQYRLAGTRGRPKIEYWFKQLGIYLIAILVMKLVVTTLLWLFPILLFFARWLIDLFGEHREAQVFFVMAVVPLCMNVLQFWLIDSLLRHNPETSRYSKRYTSEDDHEEDHEGADASARSSFADERIRHHPLDDPYSRREGSSQHIIGAEEDEEERRSTDLDPPAQNSAMSRKGYGSTMKSPPLRPQVDRESSTMDDLRIEAASILSEGRPASVRTSSEGARPFGPLPPGDEPHGMSNSTIVGHGSRQV